MAVFFLRFYGIITVRSNLLYKPDCCNLTIVEIKKHLIKVSIYCEQKWNRGVLILNKLLKIILVVLILLMAVGASFYYVKTSDSAEQKKIDKAQAQLTPEKMKVQTITEVSEIVVSQLIENVILHTEIIPTQESQNVVLSLQASEFQTEETLLKDSYNIVKELYRVPNIENFTLKWFMPVKNKNTEMLTLTFDQQTLSTMKNYTYIDLKQLATAYEKNEQFK